MNHSLRWPVAAVWCLAACGASTPTNDDRIQVGGVYDTAVQLGTNSCGPVTVQPNPTTITHAAGATSFSLEHAGVTYQGTLQSDGSFATASRQLTAGAESYSILIAGSFNATGFTASTTVQAIRPAGPCSYVVAWTGTRRSGVNIIP